VLVAAVLVVYTLGTMPGIRGFAGRLGPCPQRTRVILIRDQIVTKVGAIVLGNLLTSVVAGTAGHARMLACGVPYPVLPAISGAAAPRLLPHKATLRRLDGT
jgi:predicted PurR-regulated permease PerM